MANTAVTDLKSKRNWSRLDKQLTQAKALLRKMRETVEDIEDAKTIERAKRANSSATRVSWANVKKDLDLD